jgi:transcriptional regulator with XRE-family HTH domain
MSVTERILKKREELNFSQTDLAKRAGLKPPAISQYESGSRKPSYEALIKLSNALGVTTDYLISGKEVKSDNISDKTIKVLFKLIPNLSVENKDKLLEYAIFLSSGTVDNKIPILNEGDYADYVLKNYSDNELPIDVYKIAKKFNISIYDDELVDGEGILINGKKKVIILDKRITNKQRRKFTIAILIGHTLIPWHVQPTYTVRKIGTSTLLTDDTQEMEAQNFAAGLIMPQVHLEKDFVKMKASIESLKNLATDKYDVSLFSLANRLVDYAKDKYALIQSENFDIIKTFQGSRPIIEKLHPKSIAATFFDNPSVVEEIRKGEVPADYWLLDAKNDELIYEESIYNPEFKKVLTLIKVKS